MSEAYRLSDPSPGNVTINGVNYSFVAFYYPDYNTSWDTYYGTPYFGNFYKCHFSLTLEGVIGTFHNAEAAYQATKWWHDSASLKQFENCLTGDDAFKKKNELNRNGVPQKGLSISKRDAMFEVCKAKFSLPEFNAKILATGTSYLLEHTNRPGKDNRWSDNNDGTGTNWLGLTLMKVRAHFGGSDEPGVAGTDYVIKDFTDQVKKDVPGS